MRAAFEWKVYIVHLRRLLPSLLALVLTVSTAGGLAQAADLGVSPPTLSAEALHTAVSRRAALLLLRVTFDVEDINDVPADLDAAIDAFAADSAAPADDAEDLLAEGSYYIVSLKYLVEFGGANWPADRSAAAYEHDALAKLADLQDRWISAVQANADVLPILREIDMINAWTEGATALTPALDHFSSADELVDRALADHADRTAPVAL